MTKLWRYSWIHSQSVISRTSVRFPSCNLASKILYSYILFWITNVAYPFHKMSYWTRWHCQKLSMSFLHLIQLCFFVDYVSFILVTGNNTVKKQNKTLLGCSSTVVFPVTCDQNLQWIVEMTALTSLNLLMAVTVSNIDIIIIITIVVVIIGSNSSMLHPTVDSWICKQLQLFHQRSPALADYQYNRTIAIRFSDTTWRCQIKLKLSLTVGVLI